jgi:hypothetical protein
MSLILSGTDGLSDIDGSAATPAIRGTDANTGIFFPAADTIAFAEGGAEVARFDSSGNLGIGTASPSYKLDVAVNSNGIAGSRIQNSSSGSGAFSTLWLDNDSAGVKSALVKNSTTNTGNTGLASSLYMFYNDTGSSAIWNSSATPIQFATNNAERMRIDSSGQVGIAQTPVASGGPLQVTYNSSVNACVRLSTNNASTAGELINFIKSTGAATGAITFGASQNTIVYGGTSDYRLKENVAPMTGALATVSALKPCTYTWKEDGSEGQGFIAHELQEVFPDAVVGEKDRIDADGNPLHQMVDTGSASIIATLTAAIQELKALTDAQASTITALTARITALEVNNA